MANVEQSKLIELLVLFLDHVVYSAGGDPDEAQEEMEPMQELAKSDDALRDVLRRTICEYLKFQEPGYDGYRDHALVLLNPLDKFRAGRIYRRCIVQVAIQILLGTQVLTEHQPFLQRRKEAVGMLQKVMLSKEAADRVDAFCLMLGLE